MLFPYRSHSPKGFTAGSHRVRGRGGEVQQGGRVLECKCGKGHKKGAEKKTRSRERHKKNKNRAQKSTKVQVGAGVHRSMYVVVVVQ